MPERKIHVTPARPSLIREAAGRVAAASAEAVAGRGRFSVVLGGGETLNAVYAALALDEAWAAEIEWERWFVYFADENAVGVEDRLSHYRAARDALLGRVPIPVGQIYRIKGEGEPQAAAVAYGRLLKEEFPDRGPDLVILGLGIDGHTAGIFPYSPATSPTHHRCVADLADGPARPAGEPPRRRITTTPAFLNTAAKVIVLASGAERAEAVRHALEGPMEPPRYPAQLLDPAGGELIWLLDAEAAGMTEDED